MSTNIYLILAIIGLLFVLSYSTKLLTQTLSEFSKFFKVSYLAVGIIFMAVATSIPELFIGIESAISKTPDLSLGTVLGSNISAFALILGIIIIVHQKKLIPEKYIQKRDAYLLFIYAMVPIILTLDKEISRVDGFIFIFLFILYVYYTIKSKHENLQYSDKETQNTKKNIFKYLIKFIVGVALLLLSTHYLVKFGIEVASNFSIPVVVLGISVYALSTSLPEMVFEIKAVRSHKTQLAFGDLIGSVIVNSSLVIGTTAIICPINISSLANYIPAILFLIIILLFFILKVIKRGALRTVDGLVLISAYIIFLIIEFGVLEIIF